MININTTGRWIELGCGANPHPAAQVHVDVRFVPGVTDFACDLNEPLPISDNEFDGVLSIFAFEHVSWRKQRSLLAEVLRITKPGGRLVLVLPDTEAQLKWIDKRGWTRRKPREGMGDFEEASCVLFGDNDYIENSHRSFFSPTLIVGLLQNAGYCDIIVRPFGEEKTDMVVEATKPVIVTSEHSDLNSGSRFTVPKELKNVSIPVDYVQQEQPGLYKADIPADALQGKTVTVEPAKRKFAFDWGGSLENNSSLRQIARDLYTHGHECYLVPAAGITPDEATYTAWMKQIDVPFTSIRKVLDTGKGPEDIAAGKVAAMKELGCHVLFDDNETNVAAVNAAGFVAVKINGNTPVPLPEELTTNFPNVKLDIPTDIKTALASPKTKRFIRRNEDTGAIEESDSPLPTAEWTKVKDQELAAADWKKTMEEQKKADGAKINIDCTVAGDAVVQPYDPSVVFDMDYFDKGKMGGGFAGGGYRDFACHEVTARLVLMRKPESVLELGCARGYVLKRIQDAGVPAGGIDASKHCWMTRVCDHTRLHDFTKTPWTTAFFPKVPNDKFDICFSVATLEHIAENKLPAVIKEMARISKRGLHGVYFCPQGIDNDKTKQTLKPREWWVNLFHEHAPEYPVEILNKDELENNGQFPDKYFEGDGKVKLNIGCAQTMFHWGWENIDIFDQSQFAAANGYKFRRLDVRDGLPHATGGVDLIFSSHNLEHLTYAEGAKLLGEFRRVLRVGGVLRLAVPNAKFLTDLYHRHLAMEEGTFIGGIHGMIEQECLSCFDCINEGCKESPTPAGKLWSLLGVGHASTYDFQTLSKALEKAGFIPASGLFRKTSSLAEESLQIRREVVEMEYGGMSLFMEATPKIEG